jgi:hypothetical protein
LMISCSTETNEPNVHYELLPVDSVVMPTEFYVNVENEITVSYLKPTSCHGFDGFYYKKNDFTRTVAIQSYVIEQDNCMNLTAAFSERVLKFKPTEIGTYVFKFWKGKDINGDDVFEELSVDVQ